MMSEPNAVSMLSSPSVIELQKGGRKAGFLHGSGQRPYIFLFADLESAREYIQAAGTRGAVPVSFPTHEGFLDFLHEMQRQGTTHVGLYVGLGKAMTWTIQSFLEQQD
jgi:hypothetical protein